MKPDRCPSKTPVAQRRGRATLMTAPSERSRGGIACRSGSEAPPPGLCPPHRRCGPPLPVGEGPGVRGIASSTHTTLTPLQFRVFRDHDLIFVKKLGRGQGVGHSCTSPNRQLQSNEDVRGSNCDGAFGTLFMRRWNLLTWRNSTRQT